MFRTCVSAGAVVPCLLFFAPAWAQSRETGPASPPPRGETQSSDIVVTATPTVAQAAAEIERTPGGVSVVPDTVFKNTPVQTIKDMLQYVPGVIVQPRMGDDVRLSIRGSGLSRAYGVRGIQLTVDGIPMNTSDGLLDFFEVDPSAYRYVEVFRGANALRYGANTLGGAINLVTPIGQDAAPLDARVDLGSFGYAKAQASTGGDAGALDYFATASAQTNDGCREHSGGRQFRGNLNLGYRLSSDVETRLYVYATSTRQRIPGEVSKRQALDAPQSANPGWVEQDQQRNVTSIRIANRTVARLGNTVLEGGVFYNARHVKHPIFQWLDFTVEDHGAFARIVDDRTLAGVRNRLTLGANLQAGTIDTEQFVNLPGAVKGPLVASMVDRSRNLSLYAEESLFAHRDVALIAGVQYLNASRDRGDRFLFDGDQSGRRTFHLWSPRFGMLWDAAPDIQLFANVSRSAEVPSYDANVTSSSSTNLRPQRATTYEIGSRGKLERIGWDVALYRSTIRDELQCSTTGPFAACSIINAGRTVHQGVEAGLDASLPLTREGDRLAITAAYTFSDFHFSNDAIYGDNDLPGVPRQYLRVEALYRHAKGGYAGFNVEWAPGRYFADNANSLSVDPYALLGARAGYDFDQRWSFYLEGRNLTNKHYISTVAIAGVAAPDAEIFNPGIGRAVFGGVRLRL